MSLKLNTPLVSVIIPAYNAENLIRRAIDSVFSQTYKNFELIVIDDGSTDSTKYLLKEHYDKLIYLYQDNAGASSARNNGILYSKGELIAFLDSDDLWYPEKLQIQVDAYLKEPEVSLIHTEVDKQENFNGFIQIRADSTQARIKPFLEIFRATNLKTPSVMIPRKVLERNGLFNVNLRTAEDKDLFLRCSYKQLVLYIPQELVYCSVFPGSLCDELRSYQDNIDVIDSFLNCHPEFCKSNRSLIREVKSKIYCEYADDLCYKNELSSSLKATFYSLAYRLNSQAILLVFKVILKFFIKIIRPK